MDIKTIKITLKELILEFCKEMNYEYDKLEVYKTTKGFIFCYDDKYYKLNDDINGQIMKIEEALNEKIK